VEQISQILKTLGLDDKETKVYLSLLNLGEATVSQIAEAAQVERTGTYDVLERLHRQGLIKQVSLGKIIGFSPEDPKKILTGLDTRRSKLEQLIPQLESLYGRTLIRPVTQFYDAKEGIKALLEEALKTQSKQWQIVYSTVSLAELIGEDHLERVEKVRIAEGIAVQVLSSTSDITSSETNLITSRQLPEGISLPMTTLIFDHKAGFIYPKKQPFGWLVESSEFAKQQSQFFEGIWLISKPL